MARVFDEDVKDGFATRAVHAGQRPDESTGAVMPPIHLSTTYAQPKLGEHKGYEYSRTQNPTRETLERNLATLEGATNGLAFASGMAATEAVLSLFEAGDHVICSENVYGGTHRIMTQVFQRRGMTFSFVDTRDPDKIDDAINFKTKLVFVETPSNPLMHLTDLAVVAELVRDRGLTMAVDNTFATPYLQRPVELGVEIVVHSTTKYLNGHSDVVGGAVVTTRGDLADRSMAFRARRGRARTLPGFAGPPTVRPRLSPDVGVRRHDRAGYRVVRERPRSGREHTPVFASRISWRR